MNICQHSETPIYNYGCWENAEKFWTLVFKTYLLRLLNKKETLRFPTVCMTLLLFYELTLPVIGNKTQTYMYSQINQAVHESRHINDSSLQGYDRYL